MSVTLCAHVTWRMRRPHPDRDARLAKAIRVGVEPVVGRHGARLVCAGVADGQVHVVLVLPPVPNVPRIAHTLKRAAEKAVARHVGKLAPRWAAGYDVRSVSPLSIAQLARYVEDESGGPRRVTLPRSWRTQILN